MSLTLQHRTMITLHVGASFSKKNVIINNNVIKVMAYGLHYLDYL